MIKVSEKTDIFKIRKIIVIFSLLICIINGIFRESVLFANSFYRQNVQNIENVALFLVMADLFFDVFYSRKRISVVGWFFLFFGLISYCFSEKFTLFRISVFIIAFSDFSSDKLLREILITIEICLTVIFLLCFVGIFDNWIFLRENSQIRNSLGFNYPIIPVRLFVSVVLLEICVNKRNISYLEIVLNFIITVGLFYLTDSRMDCILAGGISLFALFYKVIDFKYVKGLVKSTFVENVFITWPLIMFLLSFFAFIIYKIYPSELNFLNRLLSGRLDLTVQAMNKYPIKLFGSNITWYGWGGYGYIISGPIEYNYIDNAYFRWLFDYGILGAGILLLLFVLIIKKVYCEKNYLIVFALLVCLLQGTIEMEGVLAWYEGLIFLILFGPVFARVNTNRLYGLNI